MLSSSASARRFIAASAARQSAASRSRIAHSSARRFVSLTQPSQSHPRTTQRDGPARPFGPSPSRCGLPPTPTRVNQRRWLASANDLPYHIVVGMPALSPTMESGTISKWNVREGESFAAGDSLAVIETDKATIDFEAQDDGVMAKHLAAAGGAELNVGTPIMVTVEEADDVAAFTNFSADAAGGVGGEAAAAPAGAQTPSAPPAAPAAPAEALPYHVVVGMPALSPTMDAGTISKWNVGEGESFAAGDSIAVIETDKATIDFEAQDDGVVAKHLVAAGSSEVAVGVPIMLTVEDEADVPAFADFAAGSTATEAPPPAAAVEPEPTAAVVEPNPAAAAPAVVAAVPASALAAPDSPMTPPAAISLGVSTWGKLVVDKSPLAKALASKQEQYIETYGSTGHIPTV